MSGKMRKSKVLHARKVKSKVKAAGKQAATPRKSALSSKGASSTVAKFEEVPDTKEHPEDRMDRMFRKVNRRLALNKLKVREEPGDVFIKMVVHLIHHGNVPEVACRALGVNKPQFKHWVQQGFDDQTLLRDTSFAKFIRAVDMAMAQEEVKQIARISRRVNNWQAIAWGLERKAFSRWGGKQTVYQGNFEDLKSKGEEEDAVLTPDVAGSVYAVLEEAGVLMLSDSPLQEEVIDITGPAVEHQTVEAQFEEVPDSDE